VFLFSHGEESAIWNFTSLRSPPAHCFRRYWLWLCCASCVCDEPLRPFYGGSSQHGKTFKRIGSRTKIGHLTAIVLLTAGCESRDERLAEFAGQALHQQARQNEEMARQSQQIAQHSEELAKAAHSLVEQDAAARRDLIAAQSEAQARLYKERTSVEAQRQELHAERQAAATAAVREPVIAQAVVVAALILAAISPLLVVVYALRRMPDSGPSETLLHESVIEFLEAECARVSRDQPSALSGSESPRLVGIGEPAED
jgi:hypothetical protein